MRGLWLAGVALALMAHPALGAGSWCAPAEFGKIVDRLDATNDGCIYGAVKTLEPATTTAADIEAAAFSACANQIDSSAVVVGSCPPYRAFEAIKSDLERDYRPRIEQRLIAIRVGRAIGVAR